MVTLTSYPETADIETSSADYARRFSGKVGEWFLRIQEQATLDMLTAYPQASILDVGGGHGQLTPGLVSHGYPVTVLGSAESCQERIRPWVETGQVEFQTGNVIDLPYPDQAFDVVLSYRLLPHVTRWEMLLAELARVAKRAVILDYPEVRSINSIAPFLFKVKKNIEGNTRPYATFREHQLLQVFQKHGFRRKKRYAEFFFPMVLHRKLSQPDISAVLEGASRRLGLTAVFGSPVILMVVREGG